MFSDPYYLKHDVDAFYDLKIRALVKVHGLEAYALYWVILERMFAEKGHVLPYSQVTLLALEETGATVDIKAMIDDAIEFGLFESDGVVFHSPALLRRMEQIDKNVRQRSEQATAAAHARWEKRRKDPVKTRPETGKKAEKKTVNDKEEAAQDAARFETFWLAYDKKERKSAALKEWKKLKVTDDLLQVILAGVEAWHGSGRWADKQFQPHPVNWLRDRRWEEVPEVYRRNGDNRGNFSVPEEIPNETRMPRLDD